GTGRGGTGRDDRRVALLGDVVVVALEPALGDADRAGEGMQLVEAGVADQGRPASRVRLRTGRVDEDGHPRSVGAVACGQPEGVVRRSTYALGRRAHRCG